MTTTPKPKHKARRKPGDAVGVLTEPGMPTVLAPGRGNLRPPWRPGQSGNPGGWNDAVREAQRLAREACPEAVLVLIGLLTSEDERVVSVAANAILDRGLGRPKEAPPPPPNAPQLDFSGATDAELATLRRILTRAASVPQADAATNEGDEEC